eukprot:scaffold31867_cov50-Phaeocystis_antarctica.AAC.6
MPPTLPPFAPDYRFPPAAPPVPPVLPPPLPPLKPPSPPPPSASPLPMPPPPPSPPPPAVPPSPLAPPPFAPQQFSVVILMEVTVSAAIRGVTAQEMITTAGNLTSDGSSTVTIEQSWKLELAVPAGANASELVASLVAECQKTSPDCKLVSSSRRALQSGGITATTTTTATAVLVRQLTSGNLIAEIPGLNSSGVSLTSTALGGVDVKLTVTQAGGADEAAALVEGGLSQEQVQT